MVHVEQKQLHSYLKPGKFVCCKISYTCSCILKYSFAYSKVLCSRYSSFYIFICKIIHLKPPLGTWTCSRMPLKALAMRLLPKKWFYGPWPAGLVDSLNCNILICFQELYPIVVAAIVWDREWTIQKLVFHCDNMGVVQVLNKGYSKSANVMKLLRRLTLVAATYNFAYSSRWVEGCRNENAEPLRNVILEV